MTRRINSKRFQLLENDYQSTFVQVRDECNALQDITNHQEGSKPVYSQLYIYDTDNEITNRISAVSRHEKSSSISPEIIAMIKDCLDQHNPYQTYNLPTTSEVAALILGDFDISYDKRDIVVEKTCGTLQRIHELHYCYLSLQYPLLFPFSQGGYNSNVKHYHNSSTNSSKYAKTVTIREYLAYQLMSRSQEVSAILHVKRLCQQFVVDGFTMMESQRIDYIKMHQQELRVDLYQGLSDALFRGERNASATGKRVILPSSFTDQLDILCRVFKMKLQSLLQVIKQEKIFGRIKAEIYTIEFQKRGLPHAHIILFLDPADKIKDAEHVDELISTEIPNKNTSPLLYDLVASYMIHGPCGHSNPRSPCMKEGKCSKYFPKKFVEETILDDNGYPTYRRRNDGRTVERKGTPLDSRYVVPYNPRLLELFTAHINVEKTNQSTSIKYLFKYINKGNDRVIAGIYNNNQSANPHGIFDEIKHYYDFRYISSCEAAWRIFAFDIHHRYPSVERLSFHLPNQQTVLYKGGQTVKKVLKKPRIKESQFLAWMECNKINEDALALTYLEFPHYYVFDKKKKIWTERKCGFAVGRMTHASPSSGEFYYLRVLLTKVKGPRSYKEIRTVENIIYLTFKSACHAMGLLEDDIEYIDAIKEAANWALGHYLRKFFVSMLLCHCLTDPKNVWERSAELLFDDIYYTPHNNQELTGLIFIQSFLNN
ncbi:uncharacterized protein LOC129301562 [Prosopis cineraria]|uniref:uncharacterized protein LOC129301562 n=1 Tax=Prosopis cineraria TaxID=364024 RepID=UPI00240FC072|nr:uncharacterized protein LOC129301562 [Prosopis cineraria]